MNSLSHTFHVSVGTICRKRRRLPHVSYQGCDRLRSTQMALSCIRLECSAQLCGEGFCWLQSCSICIIWLIAYPNSFVDDSNLYTNAATARPSTQAQSWSCYPPLRNLPFACLRSIVASLRSSRRRWQTPIQTTATRSLLQPPSESASL